MTDTASTVEAQRGSHTSVEHIMHAGEAIAIIACTDGLYWAIDDGAWETARWSESLEGPFPDRLELAIDLDDTFCVF